MAQTINIRDYIEGSKEKGIKGFLEKEDLFRNDITNIDDGDIYNEFSLQHELGIFLRDQLKDKGFKVQFERNTRWFSDKECVKSEMDIVVFGGCDEKPKRYAIELKFPTNGAAPRRMYQFVEDIKFMEQVKHELNFTQTYCLTLVSDLADGDDFWKVKREKKGIYQYFRGNTPTPIKGTIENPIKAKEGTKSKIPPYFEISKERKIRWKQIKDTSFHYYLLEI